LEKDQSVQDELKSRELERSLAEEHRRMIQELEDLPDVLDLHQLQNIAAYHISLL
jgi:hypothetical protein